MAAVNYETRRSGFYLGESASPNIINEEVIVASGSGVLYPGQVLGRVTASGKYVPHDNALANGGEVATAILFHKVDATGADVKTVATTNGPATINGNLLTFKAGISAPNKAAALTALRAKGLKVLPQHAA
jgi:hypothetical protein